jgi:hypothetical protein
VNIFINIKGKVIPALEHHNMKVYGEVQVKFHTFLTFALDGGVWLISCFDCPTPMQKAPDTH